jgi:hypothetical protein
MRVENLTQMLTHNVERRLPNVRKRPILLVAGGGEDRTPDLGVMNLIWHVFLIISSLIEGL